jgi:uncharacterized protein YoxC
VVELLFAARDSAGCRDDERVAIMTLTEWLLIIITVAAVALVVIIARLAAKMGQTLESVRSTVDRLGELAPRIDGVLTELERGLQEVHGVTVRANRIVGDVESVADEARRVALDVLNIVGFLDVTRRAHAAMAGAKAGMAMLKDAVSRR